MDTWKCLLLRIFYLLQTFKIIMLSNSGNQDGTGAGEQVNHPQPQQQQHDPSPPYPPVAASIVGSSAWLAGQRIDQIPSANQRKPVPSATQQNPVAASILGSRAWMAEQRKDQIPTANQRKKMGEEAYVKHMIVYEQRKAMREQQEKEKEIKERTNELIELFPNMDQTEIIKVAELWWEMTSRKKGKLSWEERNDCFVYLFLFL